MKQFIELTVNGEPIEVAVEAGTTLLQVLRNQLYLYGTKRSCDEGGCGCCTVLLDGKTIYACMTQAMAVQGKAIITIEGLGGNGALDPVQQAFIDAGAVQCGFCSCGMIMSAKELLDENPNPDEESIRRSISGNICRCTGYTKIVDAIKLASAVETCTP